MNRRLSPRDVFPACKVVQTDVPLKPDPFIIARMNPDRVAIVISTLVAAGVIVGVTNAISLVGGIKLTDASAPLSYDFNGYGALVQSEWWGLETAGGQMVTVIEVILERDPCPAERARASNDLMNALAGPRLGTDTISLPTR